MGEVGWYPELADAIAEDISRRLYETAISIVWEHREIQLHDHKEPNWKELRKRFRPANIPTLLKHYRRRKIFPPRWTKYRRQLRW